MTDHELFWKSSGANFEHPGDQRHIEFIRDADLAIHDAQYSEEEYLAKVGWGHSPVSYVRDVAISANVRQLALFHHDPTHDDDWIDEMQSAFRAGLAQRNSPMKVFTAAEGLELTIEGQGSQHDIAGDSALRQRSILGGRVMVISPNEYDFTLIEHMLIEDGLILMPIADPESVGKRAAEFSPDLVILDSSLSVTNGRQVVQELRDATGVSALPIVLLTDSRHEIPDGESAKGEATDYLERPFSPPMLRSRVRAWLARTLSARVQQKQARVEPVGTDEPLDGTKGPSDSGYAKALSKTKLFRHLDAWPMPTGYCLDTRRIH